MKGYSHKVISGFNASETNVYREEWYAPLISILITNANLQLEFIWDSASYKVMAHVHNEIFFHGTIFKSNEEVGAIVLTHYQSKIGHCLIGTWEEHDDSFSCLIEARN